MHVMELSTPVITAVNGSRLAAIAHASGDSSEVRHLHEAYRRGGIRAFLEARDGPFQPEPGGLRSRRDG